MTIHYRVSSGHVPRSDAASAGTAWSILLREALGTTNSLAFDFEPEIATLWITMRHPAKPCMTPELIREFNAAADYIRRSEGREVPSPRQPVKFIVLRSASEDVFNLGGDLEHFVQAIADRNADLMHTYGRAGARSCHALASGFEAAVVTISLVRGVALGGGFEAARCCDYLVAEEGASFQLPEAAFGLFAASGILSVISHRIGPAATRRLVIDGERLDCAAAADLQLIDEIATRGNGEACVRALIARLAKRHAAVVATCRGLDRARGVTADALEAEATFWAAAAMDLMPGSLTMMRRLARAQARRFCGDQERDERCQ